MNKTELKKVLSLATSTVVQIGSTIEVYIGSSDKFLKQIDVDIEKALKAGKTVKRGNVTTWREWNPIIDTSKQGSNQYIWNKTEKIKGELTEHTKIKNEITVKKLGTSFRNFFDY